jgi:hypothetical protein
VQVDPNSQSLPLRSGMSVTVEIDTGHRRGLSDLI